MPKFHVTLKASFKSGDLYWVSDVVAGDEDQAMAQAEANFMHELDDPGEWAFADADVEAL